MRHASRTKKSGAEILHANDSSYRGFPAIHVEGGSPQRRAQAPAAGSLRESGSIGSGRVSKNVRSLSRSRRPVGVAVAPAPVGLDNSSSVLLTAEARGLP